MNPSHRPYKANQLVKWKPATDVLRVPEQGDEDSEDALLIEVCTLCSRRERKSHASSTIEGLSTK